MILFCFRMSVKQASKRFNGPQLVRKQPFTYMEEILELFPHLQPAFYEEQLHASIDSNIPESDRYAWVVARISDYLERHKTYPTESQPKQSSLFSCGSKQIDMKWQLDNDEQILSKRKPFRIRRILILRAMAHDLCVWYPTVEESTLLQHVQTHHGNVMAVCDALYASNIPIVQPLTQQNEHASDMQVDQQAKAKTTRKTKTKSRAQDQGQEKAKRSLRVRSRLQVQMSSTSYDEFQAQIRAVQQVQRNRKVLAEARLQHQTRECEICASELLLKDVIMCPSETTPHSLCPTCFARTFEIRVADANTSDYCPMHPICNARLPRLMIQTYTTSIVFQAWERLQTSTEMSQALGQSPNFIQCPRCVYAEIIENVSERLLRCKNPSCGFESCRTCHGASHIPFTCAEVVAQHTQADALTETMLAYCKCGAPLLKEAPQNHKDVDSCNLLTCSACGSFVCFLCKQVLNANDRMTAYEHFNAAATETEDSVASAALLGQKCALWTRTDKVYQQRERDILSKFS